MDDIPIIPVVYIHRLVELMNGEKLNADMVLREAGINPRLLVRPDSLVTPRQVQALFRRYVGLTSHSLPALRFGQQLDLMTHGLLGHVHLWQGDFRALMETIVAYLRVRLPIVAIEFDEGRDYFSIRLASRMPGGGGNFLIQAFLGSLHTLCSPVARHIVIHCRPDLFTDPAAAGALLKCELNSDHDGNEMRFHASAAVQREAAALPAPTATLPAKSQDPFEDSSFVLQLRNHLLGHLHGRDSAEQIASAMGMSVRTLRRRLADCGLSFNKARVDVRMSVALRYLTTSSVSIERIAGMVGYSDQASFTRAFREWKGETPNVIRQQRRYSLNGPPEADHEEPAEPGAVPKA